MFPNGEVFAYLYSVQQPFLEVVGYYHGRAFSEA